MGAREEHLNFSKGAWPRVLLDSARTLQGEGEDWLAYLFGQQFSEVEEAVDRARSHRTRRILRRYRQFAARGKPPQISRCSTLVYAATHNQFSALVPVARGLARRGEEVLFVVGQTAFMQHAPGSSMLRVWSAQDLFLSFLLTFFRLPALLCLMLRRPWNQIRPSLPNFLASHRYIPYFYRLVRASSPSIVLVSNDHNVDTRSLLAVGRDAGAKTAYVQHASVSNLFPALGMDFAFLDGESALENYKHCEVNYREGSAKPLERQILLTGQQKKLVPTRTYRTNRAVGIALSGDERPSDLAPLISYFIEEGIKLRLRFHPGSGADEAILQLVPTEWISDPLKESLGDFFAQIRVLIAGNSSIHLEAGLSGVVPLYFLVGEARHDDYYGYVKFGVAKRCTSYDELLKETRKVLIGESVLDKTALQRFSATFGTPWEGKEGELVAEILSGILEEGCVPKALVEWPIRLHRFR